MIILKTTCNESFILAMTTVSHRQARKALSPNPKEEVCAAEENRETGCSGMALWSALWLEAQLQAIWFL